MQINNITVAYMSPTGGTKKVADIIINSFKDIAIYPKRYDFIKVKDRRTVHAFNPDDFVVFAVPVYFGRMPSCLYDFEVLRGRGAKAFIVSVYGNRLCEDHALELNNMLTAKGFEVVGYAEVVAQHSQDARLGAGRPNLSDAEQIKENIVKVYKELCDDKLSIPYPFVQKEYREMGTVPFVPTRLVQDKCGNCRLCSKFCPAGIIDERTHEVPEEKKHLCMGCRSCMAHCMNKIRGIPSEVLDAIAKRMDSVFASHGTPKENVFYVKTL